MRFIQTLFHPRMKHTVLSIALLASTGLAQASGGDDYQENIFTPEYHVPASELQTYARDNLRIAPPTYWRVYQFISYRALTGHPLSKAEIDLLNIDGWKVGKTNGDWNYSASTDQNGVDLWMAARKALSSNAIKAFDVETDTGDYVSFLNCPRDAFVRASQTLTQRLAQGGQQWATIWLANQDAVFANCSPQLPPGSHGKMLARPLTLPPALPAKAPDWLVKDYAYQSASALFYAGRYDEARQGYLAIAKDAKSPWQTLGHYLAARSLIRKATLMADSSAPPAQAKASNDLLRSARTEMTALAATYAPAKAMLNWLDIRLRPDERRAELSLSLAKDKINADTWQQLTDYLFLLDKIEGASMVDASDDMSAWIGSIQAANDNQTGLTAPSDNALHKIALDKARSNWKKGSDVHWLLVILANATPEELSAQENKAAASLHDDSPAYGMAQYYLAKAYLLRGKTLPADAIISAMLEKTLTPSVRNRWLRMKMVSAKTSAEFFSAAARSVVDDQRDAAPTNEGKIAKTEQGFDDDLLQHLTRHFSLDALKRYQSAIPSSQQKTINELIWTRAVILGDFAAADGVTDQLMAGRDTTRHLYERYKKATTPAAKKDAAFLIMANTPELVPYVSDLVSNSSTGEYWSCGYEPQAIDNMGTLSPAFLPPESRAKADKELTELRKLPRRSSYLIPYIINWAKKNKADPEAPKALHFLIASTRNECRAGADKKSDQVQFSREAFQFLHAQFPKSEWTAQTRYYY